MEALDPALSPEARKGLVMNVNDVFDHPRFTYIIEGLPGKIDKHGPNGCWVWSGYRCDKGYGRVTFARHAWVYAHRLMWVLAHGLVPDGLFVLHRCDNPACCNPEHLFVGTHADNMRDMHAKGRGKIGLAGMNPVMLGEEHHRAVFTPASVRAIRADTRNNAEIARAYGVGRSAIWKIKNRHWWKHVD